MYGLIFDVDGVLADTEAMSSRASVKMLEDLFGLNGVTRHDFDAGIGRGAEAYVRAAADIHGLSLTDEQMMKAVQVRQDYFLKMLTEESLPPFPGVMDLINVALASDEVRVAIATSSTREKSEATLKAAGIPYESMVYVNGSDVKRKKPAPDLFLTAVERMKLEPSDCVVIEDAPDGVAAAHAAGCRCVAVTNSVPAEKLAEAELVVNSLRMLDLPTVIRLVAAG
ncbi:MAG: HAD family phosphatase [Lentisphaerales bacterium]|nr:MAG: HAD family phosphatase [Lentisphaerales bacterium]